MTSRIEEASITARVSGNHLTLELAETLKLAAPIALTQLGQIAMMSTDLALAASAGQPPLEGSTTRLRIVASNAELGRRLSCNLIYATSRENSNATA